MPTFKFEGRDHQGQLITGERTSESAEVLSMQLFNEGITPIHILVQKNKNNFITSLKQLFSRKNVSNAELSLFTRQMYTFTKAGVPMSAAIQHLANTSRSPRLREVLKAISQKVESGQNLSSAMEQYPDVFSPLIISMVQIGQNTGQLDQSFLRLTEYLELEGTTIKKLKVALRYPIFVITAIILGIIIINIFVIPAFAKVYVQSNIELPLLTRVLISTSAFLKTYWLYILIALIILIISIRQYLKTPHGQYAWHKFQLKIPVIGFLLQRIILLRFSETFTIVVNSGIPISDGLALVAQSINNAFARDEILKMKEQIQRGSSILQAATSCKIFTGLELQMLSISEETGELGAMLNEIAQYYQREVDYDLKHLIDLLEPILLLGVALMVLFLALAVYLPIWNMVKLVHRA